MYCGKLINVKHLKDSDCCTKQVVHQSRVLCQLQESGTNERQANKVVKILLLKKNLLTLMNMYCNWTFTIQMYVNIFMCLASAFQCVVMKYLVEVMKLYPY